MGSLEIKDQYFVQKLRSDERSLLLCSMQTEVSSFHLILSIHISQMIQSVGVTEWFSNISLFLLIECSSSDIVDWLIISIREPSMKDSSICRLVIHSCHLLSCLGTKFAINNSKSFFLAIQERKGLQN